MLELGMNDFSSEGFMSPLAEPHGMEELRRRFPGELQLFEEVNRECMATQWAIDVPQKRRGVVATALFSRFITNTQAAGLLGVRGMQRQMMAMLRIALESLFTFRAVVKSQDFFEKYSRAQAIAKFKYAKSIQRLGGAAAVDQGRVSDLVTRLQAEVAAAGASEIEVWQIAEAAEMIDWYRSLYPLASTPVHTGALDLEHHLILGADGTLLELVNEPSWDEVGFKLLTLVEMMLLAWDTAGEFFCLNPSGCSEAWREKLAALAERHRSE